MAIQPNQPQSIGGVLDTTFQLYKASIGGVWPICLLLVLASTPPSIYQFIKGGIGDSTNPLNALAMAQDATYWLIYAVTMILNLWFTAAVYLKVHAVGTGSQLSIGGALQPALGRALPLLMMSILFVLALCLGLVLLVIPGLILMVSLLLGANLLLFERKGPIDALTASHRLVWGNWWRTAAILTVGFIIVMVIYLLAGVIVGVIVPFAGAEDVVMAAMVSFVLVTVVMSILVTPFYVALLIAVYWDLKLRKEGGDLADRVGALNAA